MLNQRPEHELKQKSEKFLALPTKHFRDAYNETIKYTSNDEVLDEHRIRGLGLNPLIKIRLSSTSTP